MMTTARTRTLRPVLAAAAALGIALSASACGGGGPAGDDAAASSEESAPPEGSTGDGDSSTDTPSESESDTDTEPDADTGAAGGGDSDAESAASDAGAAVGEETQIEIGETIEDPDMGDTIEVLSAVRDFPSEEEAETIADGGEVVLLEVAVTPGQEYGGLISMGSFEISWDEGADFWNNQTRMVEDELEAADYPVLEDVSRRDGGEPSGWMAFVVDERAESYQVRYERGGAEVIGSDEVIDPFESDVAIPAS